MKDRRIRELGNQRNQKVDVYFSAGCGRCHLVNTPECKVHNWTAELETLREIVLECGLTEELKWSQPVYTFEGKNIVLLAAFNENCVISFFKGALLRDEAKILQKPGENTQAGRVIRFTKVQQIENREKLIKAYILEAVEAEKSGLQVAFKETKDFEVPLELTEKFAENPALKIAFDALTPGRRRGYLLHFAQPKQSATRTARIEKCLPQIMMGIGLNDVYAAKNKLR